MSATALSFMGICEPETVRCRIYGSDHDERLEFVRRLANRGVLDAPAYDNWIDALRERQLVDYRDEPIEGGGNHRRWFLNDAGRAAMRRLGVEVER